MMSRYIAVIISFVGILSAVALTVQMSAPLPPSEMQGTPAKNPYPAAISAAGIVEAAGEHISVGTQAYGIITQIHKSVGESVKRGDPLLTLDCRELVAEAKVKHSQVEVAQAKLTRIQDQLDRLKSIQDLRAISHHEVTTKENDVLVAKGELHEALAELEWVQTKIECLTLNAPQDGVIIQKKAKVGETLSPSSREPPFVIGDLNTLQIRADIDEQHASWLKPGTDAMAYPKNRPDMAIPLKFIRIEPYMIPKKSLTGLSDERVDTRVLQVIYAIHCPEGFNLYVGQQVDVFIDMETGS